MNSRDGGDSSDNGRLSIGFEQFTKKRVEIGVIELDNRLEGIQITRDNMGGLDLIHRLTYKWDEEQKQYVQFIPDANYKY